MKVKNIDIFSPYLLVAVIILYVALALVAYQYHLRNLNFISNETLFAVFFGTLFFIIGALIPKLIGRFNLIPQLNTDNISKDKLKDKLQSSKLNYLLSEKVVLAVVLVAIFLELLNTYLLGGIPLFSGYLKAKSTTDFWRISYILFLPAITILIAKYRNRWYYLLALIGWGLFVITGYRTTTMAILISIFIAFYYTRGLKFKHFLVFAVIAAVIGIVVGYIAVKSIEWQQWTLNPLQLVAYRAGFTLMVFDKVVHMAGATHGAMFYNTFTSGHPRYIVGDVVLGYHKMITSTIFGPAMLDFGYIGLAIQMFILGFVLRLMHSAHRLMDGTFTALYAVILSSTLIWTETGPTDFSVWFFYALSVIALIVLARTVWGISKKGSKSGS